MIQVLNFAARGRIYVFDFVDDELGLEFTNWRLAPLKRGGWFVASAGASFETADGLKTKDYIRVADFGRDPRGKQYIAAVLQAALDAKDANEERELKRIFG